MWTGIQQDQPALVGVFSHLYAFFALLLWPVFVPLAVFRLEPGDYRRRAQEVLWIVGLCVAVLITGSMARYGLSVDVVDGHLAYRVGLPHLYESVGLYFLAVSAPCLSSHRYVQAFGVLLVAGLALALARFAMELVSVWCLAAALMSLLVVAHLRSERPSFAPEPGSA